MFQLNFLFQICRSGQLKQRIDCESLDLHAYLFKPSVLSIRLQKYKRRIFFTDDLTFFLELTHKKIEFQTFKINIAATKYE